MSAYIPRVRRFSRRWWLDLGRDLFWVVVVTVLVWAYAEMKFTGEKEFRIAIVLSAEGADRVLVSRSITQAAVTIRGSQVSLNQFQKKLADDGMKIPFEVSREYEPGPEHVIRVADILAKIPDVDELGLEILSASPSAITGVQVDTLERREVPVNLQLSNVSLVKMPKLSVTVEAARGVWEKILQREPKPELTTEPVDLKDARPGEATKVTAKIVPLLAGMAVQPLQSEVTATVQVLEHTGTGSVDVSVRVLTPWTWGQDNTWQEYKLETRRGSSQWVKHIEVTGPREDIDKLRREDVLAYIVLTDANKVPTSLDSAPVQVHLPDGLRLKLKEGQDLTVEFRLTKRNPDAPP
jgi:hypothetical protein